MALLINLISRIHVLIKDELLMYTFTVHLLLLLWLLKINRLTD